jgi:hypothetical protein
MCASEHNRKTHHNISLIFLHTKNLITLCVMELKLNIATLEILVSLEI